MARTLLLFVLLAPVYAWAGSVTLVWDPVSSPALAGYTLHYGPSAGTYTTAIDVGNTTSRTVSNLAEGATLYFAVTAHDSAGASSGYSNEIAKSIPYAIPVADFSASTQSGAAPLALNFVSSSTGSISSYAWTFGDGSTSSVQNPTKTYASAGAYTVSLVVNGPGGTSTKTKTNYIAVSGPVDAIAPTAPASLAATAVATNRVDLGWSASTDNVGVTGYRIERCVGGGCTSFVQVGMPTGTAYSDTTVAASTVYSYRVRAIDAAGNLSAYSNTAGATTATAAPVAAFVASTTTGTAPLAVNFTSTSTGNISAYAWAFGDGTTSSVQNPSKTYSVAGTYTVSLTVTGAGGSNTQTKTGLMTILAPPPATTVSRLGLVVDAHSASGTSSNLNGVLEPGEIVRVEPMWLNGGTGPVTLTATASVFAGPAGATYSRPDPGASYGSIAPGIATTCHTATANCYRLSVSNPATRPNLHWDARFTETLSNGDVVTSLLHVGHSFSDVPDTDIMYRYIETLLHNNVTAGYADGTFKLMASSIRMATAIFVARGIVAPAGDAAIPTSGQIGTQAYNCAAGGTSRILDVLPTDTGCKHAHYLQSRNVSISFECTSSRMCPSNATTRAAMAVMVSGALAAGGDAGVPASGTFSDSGTARSYNCGVAGGSHFADVPASSAYCRHVNYLWARDVIAGYGDGTFKPADSVIRSQLAKFLVEGMAFTLY